MKVTSLESINLKLKILGQVIREARAAGDERWKEPARQAAILNEQRAALLKADYKRRGIPEPEPQRITVTVGTMGAKGER